MTGDSLHRRLAREASALAVIRPERQNHSAIEILLIGFVLSAT